MMRLVWGVALVAAGCSSSNPSYTVGGQTLTVKDSGYLTSDGRFCQGAGAGQFRLVLVDYSPICGPGVGIDADGGARDVSLEHNELELIYVTAGHTDPKSPYLVTAPNCDIGPAGPGMAWFRHFPAATDVPVETAASDGQIFLTSIDASGSKPAKGSFDLDFGAQGHITGDFSTYTCN